MNAIRRMKGARFEGRSQKTFSDCSSHNTVGHGTGFDDAQATSTGGDLQQGRINSGGIYVWPALREMHRSRDYPHRSLLRIIKREERYDNLLFGISAHNVHHVSIKCPERIRTP